MKKLTLRVAPPRKLDSGFSPMAANWSPALAVIRRAKTFFALFALLAILALSACASRQDLKDVERRIGQGVTPPVTPGVTPVVPVVPVVPMVTPGGGGDAPVVLARSSLEDNQGASVITAMGTVTFQTEISRERAPRPDFSAADFPGITLAFADAASAPSQVDATRIYHDAAGDAHLQYGYWRVPGDGIGFDSNAFVLGGGGVTAVPSLFALNFGSATYKGKARGVVGHSVGDPMKFVNADVSFTALFLGDSSASVFGLLTYRNPDIAIVFRPLTYTPSADGTVEGGAYQGTIGKEVETVTEAGDTVTVPARSLQGSWGYNFFNPDGAAETDTPLYLGGIFYGVGSTLTTASPNGDVGAFGAVAALDLQALPAGMKLCPSGRPRPETEECALPHVVTKFCDGSPIPVAEADDCPPPAVAMQFCPDTTTIPAANTCASPPTGMQFCPDGSVIPAANGCPSPPSEMIFCPDGVTKASIELCQGAPTAMKFCTGGFSVPVADPCIAPRDGMKFCPDGSEIAVADDCALAFEERKFCPGGDTVPVADDCDPARNTKRDCRGNEVPLTAPDCPREIPLLSNMPPLPPEQVVTTEIARPALDFDNSNGPVQVATDGASPPTMVSVIQVRVDSGDAEYLEFGYWFQGAAVADLSFNAFALGQNGLTEVTDLSRVATGRAFYQGKAQGRVGYSLETPQSLPAGGQEFSNVDISFAADFQGNGVELNGRLRHRDIEMNFYKSALSRPEVPGSYTGSMGNTQLSGNWRYTFFGDAGANAPTHLGGVFGSTAAGADGITYTDIGSFGSVRTPVENR